MRLTPNFSLGEFTRTSAPFNNRPGPYEVKNLHILALAILQPLRDHYGKPVVITSGFRNSSTNQWVGGAGDSQHKTGEAADLTIPGEDVWQYAKWIARRSFDQLIIYPGQNRVHVSYKSEEENRGQILQALTSEGRTRYEAYPLYEYGWPHER